MSLRVVCPVATANKSWTSSKELTLRGKLIFVVIHQPSSDIFKLFDRLLLLDYGGFPIYQGNPLESLGHFRQLSNHANNSDALCHQCGTVNPEELFDTVEARMVDEFGQLTDRRRVQPEEWNDYYNLLQGMEIGKGKTVEETPPLIAPPRWWKQFKVYARREAAWQAHQQAVSTDQPARGTNSSVDPSGIQSLPRRGRYVRLSVERKPPSVSLHFRDSVVVHGAERQCRGDLERPSNAASGNAFLQLNWTAYLTSKVSLMFGLSAVQSASYALISIVVLRIPDAFGMLFLTLFSLSCFANMLGTEYILCVPECQGDLHHHPTFDHSSDHFRRRDCAI